MNRVYIGNGNGICIGAHSRINENVRLDNVHIGSHVMIARDIIILGKVHGFDDTEIPMNIQEKKQCGITRIEDDVWIGVRSIILPEKIIRRGPIIGAGAIVTKDTDEFGIYGGIPAKLIRKRTDKNT